MCQPVWLCCLGFVHWTVPATASVPVPESVKGTNSHTHYWLCICLLEMSADHWARALPWLQRLLVTRQLSVPCGLGGFLYSRPNKWSFPPLVIWSLISPLDDISYGNSQILSQLRFSTEKTCPMWYPNRVFSNISILRHLGFGNWRLFQN